MTAQFRIGGYYKQRDGRVVLLEMPGKLWISIPGEVAAYLVEGEKKYVIGARRLSDGLAFPYDRAADQDTYALLPGELHNVNGEWVPVAEEAPKTSLQLSAPLCGSLQHAKKVRPALTWATPKPVDRWEGYEVYSGFVDYPEPLQGSPLQRMTDPSDPAHGSAFLR